LETVVSKKLYEAMFLIDSAKASADWDGVLATIRNILEKADAEIDSITKWAERKLAYKINGKSRGTYILCYFRADGGRIREIEREIKLSEQIMRVLILSAESISREDIALGTPYGEAQSAEGKEESAEPAPAVAEERENRRQKAENRRQKTENI
jgi:small subunit ribosomal protein S6